jgi:hypothetical protein
MSFELPSPLQLVDAPELAALHVLEVTLATAQHAILAAHPDLEEQSFLSIEEWLADAILVHVSGLEVAVRRYREQLRRRGLLTPPDF